METIHPEDGVTIYVAESNKALWRRVIVVKKGHTKTQHPACGNNTYQLVYGKVRFDNTILAELDERVHYVKGSKFDFEALEDSCYILWEINAHHRY